MMIRGRCRSRAGLTVLELMLALALLGIIVVKASQAISSAVETVEQASDEVVLEDQARRVLRQIGFAVMAANRESLMPDRESPLSAENIRYQVNLGIQDGEVIWSDPEQVALDLSELNVYWSRNPETETERRVVWTSLVSPYLEGELPNGLDDNGNGLIDEQGLSFVVDRNSVTIRLTLDRIMESGEAITKTVQTTVTCRNLEQEDG